MSRHYKWEWGRTKMNVSETQRFVSLDIVNKIQDKRIERLEVNISNLGRENSILRSELEIVERYLGIVIAPAYAGSTTHVAIKIDKSKED